MQGTARRLAPAFLYLLVLMVGLGLALVALLIVGDEPAQDRYLIPGILGLLWLLMGISIINLFQASPPQIVASQGWLQKLRIRVIRLIYYLLMILVIGVVLGLFISTWQLVFAWLRINA